MAKLSLWLPPFSPDYSGVSAVLFDLKTVTAMHDASGCTGNYTGYDEPRWYGSRSGIYCSGLREMDAVLGDDEKLMKKMMAAAEDVRPELMALVGSPVPMVIGADLKGIAAELEERTGIPCFGFDTTGTAYYDRGAFLAAKALLERFARAKSPVRNRVNILGALPMDFGLGEDLDGVKTILAGAGYETGLCLAMGYSLEDLKHAATAGVNLAVSRAGYWMALYMEKKFGIPYVCGFPAGEEGERLWLSAVNRVMSGAPSEILKGREAEGGPKALVIGEQVMGNAIRTALQEECGFQKVSVGSLYGLEPALSLDCDLDLTDEKKIKAAVNDPEYDIVIADPFLKVLLDGKSRDPQSFLPLSQYAVSSKLGQADAACLSGRNFQEWFKRRNIE